MTFKPVPPEGQRILFLDIEGVMTRGMLRQGANPLLGAFGYFAKNDGTDGDYSNEASRLVQSLVREYDFRIVLITRHSDGEITSHVLQKRLAYAGIAPEWLYRPDPEAIPQDTQSKGDSVLEWRARNPHVRIENMVAIEDNPESLHKALPLERIIRTNPAKGFIRPDYDRLLGVMGIKRASRAILRP
jgi:hypothetical protein